MKIEAVHVIHHRDCIPDKLLTWTNAAFDLKSAPAITGGFTNIPNATNPYTNPINGH
jgi:hypothetical protein